MTKSQTEGDKVTCLIFFTSYTLKQLRFVIKICRLVGCFNIADGREAVRNMPEKKAEKVSGFSPATLTSNFLKAKGGERNELGNTELR